MPQIHISVRDKIARTARRTPCIVCGNADYEIVFDFDSEWDAHDQRIARFIWGGAYYDVPFTGNACPVPTVLHASEVEVGVYAGELRTTTPATVACRRSIRSDPSLPLSDEAVKQYESRAMEASLKAENAASAALQASLDAQAAKAAAAHSAEQATERINQAEELLTRIDGDTADARAHAEQMLEHAAATRTRYAFTVGQPEELDFMTQDSGGIYSVSQGYRYNDKQVFTVYRYPLCQGTPVGSAVWHAHLAQQTLLQASTDGKTWVTLRDNADQQIGTQDHYELCDVLDLKDTDTLYIKIADSDPSDGAGGAILSDIPVTLDVTYGQSMPFALPTVGADDEGSYLRVIGGRWQVADASALTSRVRTYSFRVGEASEAKYLDERSCGILNTTCRFHDRSAFTIYRYRIANAALVRRVTWTATVGQQLRIECSADGESWSTVFDADKTNLAFARTTYDLTDKLNLLAFDEVYIRISDSDPSDGFGGAIQRSESVELHVERCEPPIYM